MKYYVAYGSNLNREQMAHRCPEAKLVGTGMLSNYEMVFRGNKSNAVATVEPKKGMEVPVGIWEISENDEKYLDEAVEKMKETVLNQTEAAMYPYGYRDVRQ